MKSPEEIIELMLNGDAYSSWLGVTVHSISPGHCIISCQVTGNMLNGFGIAHGGIAYALADSALAFASNSHGNQCVSIETSISHVQPVQLKDVLTANCAEIQIGKSLGRYTVSVTDQNNKLVAQFNGTVFRTNKLW